MCVFYVDISEHLSATFSNSSTGYVREYTEFEPIQIVYEINCL